MDIITVKHVEINMNMTELCLASKKLANATAELFRLSSATRQFANKTELVIHAATELNTCIGEYNNSLSKLYKLSVVNPADLLNESSTSK